MTRSPWRAADDTLARPCASLEECRDDGLGVVRVAHHHVPAGQSDQHAFLYRKGTMLDLNTLDTSSPLASYVTLNSATGINDHGWIVAYGVDSRTGGTHAYLLIPLKSHR